MTGSGTAEDPYIIESLADLQAMENNLAAYYELGGDIDASATSGWNGGLGFDPIGTYSTPFTGNFDGKGYTVSNLFINRPTEGYAGLFGVASGGEIGNAGIASCNITGKYDVGALLGRARSSVTISNCYSTGIVTAGYTVGGLIGGMRGDVTDCHSACSVISYRIDGQAGICGGLAGRFFSGGALRCYATGSITVTSTGGLNDYCFDIGGFAGVIGNASMCYATGNIVVNSAERAQRIGGFAGFDNNSGPDIDNCYSRGSLTVTVVDNSWGFLGGFIGRIAYGGTISNCYSTGSITETAGMPGIGGFCGKIYAGTITNCFWDTQTSGEATSDGGTGKTTAEMKTASTFSDAGWDLTTIWTICTGVNSDYPCLIDITPSCIGIAAIPTVTTDPATEVEEETATGNGNITDNGGEDCDKRGICWNTTGSPTVEDNKSEETDSFGTGAFSRPITGLSPGIKYYVKAYAHNSAGYGYGGEESFTTKPNAPSNLACVVQSSSQIDVDWIQGTGATRTMVRRKVGSYPSDVTDGDQAYYGNGTSFNDNPLVRATHYYYRAWSWVEGGDIWSDDYAEDNARTLIGVPAVTTDTATGIAAALATLNGTLADDGGEACDCGFEWGQDVPYGNTTSTESRTMGQTFAQTITGLQPKTTYRFRAFATNSAGTSYGTIRTFTTPARLPITTTNPATGTSTLNGTLDDDGGEACECGFQWGETEVYGKTTPTQSRRTRQSVLQTIGELLPDTTYHFRAFATNSRGTDYGADRSFTTPAALPTVATNPATELGAIAATLNGTLEDDGGEACDCGFEFGLDTGYGTITPTESKITDEDFSQVIGGLAPNTTYHFRAFATNSSGTGYGADRTFTTALVISRAFALAREEL